MKTNVENRMNAMAEVSQLLEEKKYDVLKDLVKGYAKDKNIDLLTPIFTQTIAETFFLDKGDEQLRSEVLEMLHYENMHSIFDNFKKQMITRKVLKEDLTYSE
jgi:Mg/Co/Ni transporter MgtE